MYERFGSTVDRASGTVTFRLFVPDGERAPDQYEGGGLPRLTAVGVVGSFQNPPWNFGAPLAMAASDFIDPESNRLKGTVYSCSVQLPPGFYDTSIALSSRTPLLASLRIRAPGTEAKKIRIQDLSSAAMM